MHNAALRELLLKAPLRIYAYAYFIEVRWTSFISLLIYHLQVYFPF